MTTPIGNIVKLIKDNDKYGLRAGQHVVVVAYDKKGSVEGRGSSREGKDVPLTSIVAATAEKLAKDLSLYLKRGDAATDGEKKLGKKAQTELIKRGLLEKLTNQQLGTIHKEWKRDLIGVEPDPPSNAQVVRALVGKTVYVVDALFGDFSGSFTGDVVVEEGLSDSTFVLTRMEDDDLMVSEDLDADYIVMVRQDRPPMRSASLLEVELGSMEHVWVVGKHMEQSAKLASRKVANVSELLTVAKTVTPAVGKLTGKESQADKKRIASRCAVALQLKIEAYLKAKGVEKFTLFTDGAFVGKPSAVADKLALLLGKARAPAEPVVVDLAESWTNMPRLGALHSRAADEATFQKFVETAFKVLTAQDDLEFQIGKEDPSLMRGKIERWMSRLGEITLPDALAPLGVADQKLTSGEMLQMFFEWREIESSGGGKGSATSSGGGGAGLSYAAAAGGYGFNRQIDTSGTEDAQRKRQTLMQAAIEVVNNPSEQKVLSQLRALLSSPSQLQEGLEKASDPIKRLLTTGDEIMKAINGHFDADIVAGIAAIRGALRRAHENAFTSKEVAPSEVVSRALNHIRLGSIGAVDLLWLCDIESQFSRDSPLKCLQGKAKDSALPLFYQGLQKLQFAWMLAAPQFSSQISQFVNRVGDKVSSAVKAGVPWFDADAEGGDVSTWWVEVMRHVDKQASKYALKEVTDARFAAPNPEWASSSESSHGQRLARAISEATAARVAQAKVEETQGAAQQSRYDQLAAEIAALKRNRPAPRDGEKKGKKTKVKAKDAAAALQPAPALPAPTTPKGVGDFDGKSRAAQTEFLKQSIGDKDVDGVMKFPCVFFHTKSKKCQFDADKCRGHHLA